MPHKHVFDFNQALMDFGATVCTATEAAVRDVPDATDVSDVSIHADHNARRHEGAKATEGPDSGLRIRSSLPQSSSRDGAFC